MANITPLVGTPVEEIDTPALVLDLAILERNIEIMHAFFRNRPGKVRNVTKGHKCPEIAKRQMQAVGAVPLGIGSERRAARARERIQRLLDTRQDLERAGIAVEICGAGSTTSWNIAGAMDGITEIDPGSYVLMDSGLAEAIPDLEFSPAISVA